MLKTSIKCQAPRVHFNNQFQVPRRGSGQQRRGSRGGKSQGRAAETGGKLGHSLRRVEPLETSFGFWVFLVPHGSEHCQINRLMVSGKGIEGMGWEERVADRGSSVSRSSLKCTFYTECLAQSIVVVVGSSSLSLYVCPARSLFPPFSLLHLRQS